MERCRRTRLPHRQWQPGAGKTHRAYLWSYCTTQFNPIYGVVFDFTDSRGGQHVRDFLKLSGTTTKPGWQGKLVTDDLSGYKVCFELGVIEVGRMAHARRKFHHLWINHGSQVGEHALKFFCELYDVEREVAEAPEAADYNCDDDDQDRQQMRCISGCASSDRGSPMDQRFPRRSITASSDGMRSHASWMTAICRSTTTG